MGKLLERAKAEYARVVAIPHGSWERHYNQVYMAFLRDFIAESEGLTSEEVQTEYEEKNPPPPTSYSMTFRGVA